MSNVSLALQTDAYRQLHQTLQDAHHRYFVAQQTYSNAQRAVADGPRDIAEKLAAYNNAAAAVATYVLNYVPPMNTGR